MTTQFAALDPQPALDAPSSAEILRHPILDAPLDAPLEPVPDALLNRPVPKKRAGRKKGTKNKPRVRAPERDPVEEPKPEEKPTPPAQQLATPPHGNSLPNVRFSLDRVATLLAVLGIASLPVLGWLVGYYMTGMGR